MARLEYAFAIFIVMFMTGGLTRLLAGGVSQEVAETQQSPLVQLTGLLIYFICVSAIFLRFKTYLPEIGRNLLLLLPVLFTVASIFWSQDFDLTFRRSIALLLTTAVAAYFAMRFDIGEIANLMFVGIGIIVLASAIVSLALPGFGVHQASESGASALHAGSWRGLFWHKNRLGPVVSFYPLIVVAFWHQIRFSRSVKLAAILLAGVVTVQTGSSLSLFQFVLISCTTLFHLALRRTETNVGIAILCFVSATAFMGVVFWDDILRWLLDVLGRDPTLSSRTYIWQAALLGIAESPLIGGGYQAGWHANAADFAEAHSFINVDNAHNGYLEATLDIGLIGLALLSLPFLQYLSRIHLVRKRSYPLYFFGFHFLLFYLIMNFIESFLMKYQNIHWLLFCIVIISAGRLMRGKPAERAEADRTG